MKYELEPQKYYELEDPTYGNNPLLERENNGANKTRLYLAEEVMSVANSIAANSESKETLFTYLDSLINLNVSTGILLIIEYIEDNMKEYTIQDIEEIFTKLFKIIDDEKQILIFYKFIVSEQKFVTIIPLSVFPRLNYYFYPYRMNYKTAYLENIFAEKCKLIIQYQAILEILEDSNSDCENMSFLLECESLNIKSLEFIIINVLKSDYAQIINPFTASTNDEFTSFSASQTKILSICLLYGISKANYPAQQNDVLSILKEFSRRAVGTQFDYILRIVILLFTNNFQWIYNPSVFNSLIVAASNCKLSNDVKIILELINATMNPKLFNTLAEDEEQFFNLLEKYELFNSSVISHYYEQNNFGILERYEWVYLLEEGEFDRAYKEYLAKLQERSFEQLLLQNTIDVCVEFNEYDSKYYLLALLAYGKVIIEAPCYNILLKNNIPTKISIAQKLVNIYNIFSSLKMDSFGSISQYLSQSYNSEEYEAILYDIVLLSRILVIGLYQSLDITVIVDENYRIAEFRSRRREELLKTTTRLFENKIANMNTLSSVQIMFFYDEPNIFMDYEFKPSIFYLLELLMRKENVEHEKLEINYYVNHIADCKNYIMFILLSFQYSSALEPIVEKMLQTAQLTEIQFLALTLQEIVAEEQYSEALSFIFEKENPEINFYRELVSLSASLIGESENQRSESIYKGEERLNEMLEECPAHYLTNTNKYINSIESIKMLKSHAKVPLLFHCNDDYRFIIKANDSVIEDHLVECLVRIFKENLMPLQLQTIDYQIIPFSAESGYIEMIESAYSLDEIGNRSERFLVDYFKQQYTTAELNNFISSFAFSSIVSYILQFKDRHNGNIMLNDKGVIAHIDFGFLLESAPGSQFSIEKAPFKYPKAFTELIGNTGQEEFCEEFTYGLFESRYFMCQILVLLEYVIGLLPCCKRQETLSTVKKRFSTDLFSTEFLDKCVQLIEASRNSIGNNLYDRFQALENEINF